MIMKKNLLFAALALTTLAGCTDDSFVGDQSVKEANGSGGAIAFNSNSATATRALTGAAAAEKLNSNFVVEGIKSVTTGESTTTSEVFDNYNVNYVANTAATTASNSANWEYVNQTILSGKTAVAEQTIKYWDFAAKQYDFWAYSLGVSSGGATVTSLEPDANLGTSAYTITGTKAQLSTVYISDLVTAYNPVKSVSGVAEAKTPPAVMGNEVDLTFRSLLAKVRVGLYETVPGYSVRNVQFYPSASGTPADAVALYTSSNLPAFDATNNDATYKVYFPTTGPANIGNSDYNKAHVAITSDDVANKVEFGTLSYGAHQDGKKEKTGFTAAHDDVPDTWTEIWVQRSASTCTWAKEAGAVSAGDYSVVLPYETGAVLTLKLDYTLESIDGTGETIVVHGATALVPAAFTQWKANYAYTYIFKISDNTNGLTNTVNTDKTGLYPITLDAIVVGNEEGTQETITTVATPSITTYSVNSNVITNNEYTTSDDIYVVATTDGTLMSMTDKATLYDITKSSSAYAATEAEVLEALNTYSTKTGASAPYTYTGRNSVVLTPVASSLDLTGTTVPTVDGQTVSVTAGQAALIDKSKLTAGHYYAYVFETTPASPAPTTTDKYEAIAVTVGTTVVTGKYVYKNSAYSVVTSDDMDSGDVAKEGVTYYDKYTEVSGATYAIKVIKIKP